MTVGNSLHNLLSAHSCPLTPVCSTSFSLCLSPLSSLLSPLASLLSLSLCVRWGSGQPLGPARHTDTRAARPELGALSCLTSTSSSAAVRCRVRNPTMVQTVQLSCAVYNSHLRSPVTPLSCPRRRAADRMGDGGSGITAITLTLTSAYTRHTGLHGHSSQAQSGSLSSQAQGSRSRQRGPRQVTVPVHVRCRESMNVELS